MAQRFTPKLNLRGTSGLSFPELSMALGPQQIGVTGDNSYEALYGRAWLMVWDAADNFLKLYQQDAVGEWTRVTTDLPPPFGAEVPAGARRYTFAFDQSARVIVVYQIAELVYVTRWDPGQSAYIQNVTFAGVDPTVLMDATLADPNGYPNLAEDGWSVREAYFAGIPVIFQWIPNGAWLDDAIPDSDVLLFYLTTDRLQVRCRVQRQQYATESVIHTFAEPVILDRAIALPARYELLLSNAAGEKLPNILISAAYFEDIIINPNPSERGFAAASPGPGQYRQLQVKLLESERGFTAAEPNDGTYRQTIHPLLGENERGFAAAAPRNGVYQQTIYPVFDSERSAAAAEPITGTYRQLIALVQPDERGWVAAEPITGQYREA